MMESLSFEKENIIEQKYTAIKVIRNLFRLEKETKAIKDKILRDIKNVFEHEEEESCFKPVRVTIANDFISSTDNNEELIMH